MTPGSEKMGEGPLSEMEGSTQIDEVVNQLTGEGREDIRMVLIDKIHPSPFQAREEFDQEALDRLAESVEKTGLHHPLTVRKDGNGGFELVAGERRWRACKQIDREVVPCLVKDMDDIESRMVGLAENLAREDLTPIEEARGMARLKKALERADQNSSVRELKRITGRSIGAISEALRWPATSPTT